MRKDKLNYRRNERINMWEKNENNGKKRDERAETERRNYRINKLERRKGTGKKKWKTKIEKEKTNGREETGVRKQERRNRSEKTGVKRRE